MLALHPQLRVLAPSHLTEVALAFRTLTPDYFLNRLGSDLLADTYWRVFCDDPDCFGFVWMDADRVVGFVAGTAQRDRFLSRVVARAPGRFIVRLVATALGSPHFLKQGFGLGLTLWQERHREGPAAELMSLGVLPRELRPVPGAEPGVSPARVLMAAAMAAMRERNAPAFRMYTGAANHLARAFYKRLGFVESHQLQLFGEAKVCFIALVRDAVASAAPSTPAPPARSSTA